MSKILQKYTKFSTKELEEYASNPESCVRCVNDDMHLAMGPYGMASFKHALHELLVRTKVGIYNAHLNGIVLGIKNIKVLGQNAAIRADDPILHLSVNADFYVFRPVAGAELCGIVRHITKHQVSAIIYRVFNTKIRFTNKAQARNGIVMEQDIKFRIKDFDISNGIPYIEGELLLEEAEQNTTLELNSSSPELEDAKPNIELDALVVELIKQEPLFETDQDSVQKKKATKRKKSEIAKETPTKKTKIKVEPL